MLFTSTFTNLSIVMSNFFFRKNKESYPFKNNFHVKLKSMVERTHAAKKLSDSINAKILNCLRRNYENGVDFPCENNST